jgi:two-component system, chemotaxis family, chemotaxis protein CheY
MPRVDGIELIKRVRSMPNYRFTPILMLTTDASSERKAEGQAAGATGWIIKPFEPEQLLKVIKRVLPG